MNKIEVNNISFDQDNSILCVATDRGYRIYEINNYSLLNDITDYQDLIGSIQLAVPFYKSRLIFFVGTDYNLSFPTNQLIIWDDFKNKKIGMIMLNQKILDIKISKNAIFIVVHKKIFLFELLTLKYVCAFEDVDLNIKTHSFSLLTNPIVLAYSSQSNKSIIKISKILINENGLLDSKFQMMVITTFNEIQALQISIKSDILMAFSQFGNKIHIYSLEDFQLKFCLFLIFNELIILNSCFNKKSRFFSVLSFSGTDLNLNIFDLKKLTSEDHLCHCDDNDDDEIIKFNHNNSGTKNIEVLPRSNSFFGSFFTKINNIFSEDIKSFAKLKIKPPKHFYIELDNFKSPFLLNFHHIYQDTIV